MKQMFDKRELALSSTSEDGLRIKYYNYPKLQELCNVEMEVNLENEEIDEVHLLMLQEDDVYDNEVVTIKLNDKIKRVVVYTDFKYSTTPIDVLTPVRIIVNSNKRFLSNYSQISKEDNIIFDNFIIDNGFNVLFSVNMPSIVEFDFNKKSFINKELIKYDETIVEVKKFNNVKP